MTLGTTNLNFSALQTEYGGSNPISMSEYYKGGSFVPSNQSSSYGTIPASGAISLGVFRGTTKFTGLDFRTVTAGYVPAPKGGLAYYGYSAYTANSGSISPSTNSTLSGHNYPILNLRASEVFSSSSYLEFLIDDGGVGTNSGFTTMTIANNTTSLSFSRSSATFGNSSVGSSTSTGWTWSGSAGPGNMFTAAYSSGETVSVTWT